MRGRACIRKGVLSQHGCRLINASALVDEAQRLRHSRVIRPVDRLPLTVLNCLVLTL